MCIRDSLKVPAQKLIKTLLYVVDGKPVAALDVYKRQGLKYPYVIHGQARRMRLRKLFNPTDGPNEIPSSSEG